MIELLNLWQLQKSDLKLNQLAEHASNIIFVSYLLLYLINRKAVCLTVFFVCEMVAYTSIVDYLTDAAYYLLFASVYSWLYYYLVLSKASIKSILWCAIIVLFNIGAILDATFFPETETIFYKLYELIVIFVHLGFINSFINWKILWRTMGAISGRLFSVLGAINSLQFIWYNIHTHNKKEPS